MMRTDKIIVTVLLLCILIWFPLWGEQAGSHDRSLSFVYSDIAVSLLKEEPSSAFNMAGIALEFYPENGDAGFICASVLLKKDNVSLHTVKDILKKAYDEGIWKLYSKEVCRIMLAGVYDQLMDYTNLNTLIMDNFSTPTPGAAWYYYAARGALMTGDRKGALQFLKDGTALFPGDSKLLSERIGIDSAYADMMVKSYFSSSDGVSPGTTVLASLAAVSDPPVRNALLSELQASGAEAPEAELLSAEQQLTGMDDETDMSALLNEKFLTRLDYFNRVMSLFNRHQRIEEFWQALEEKSLVVQGDRNDDGYPEETYQIENGMVTEYSIDTDQDRIPDYSVVFTSEDPKSGSIPSVLSLAVRGKGQVLTFTYSKYPVVDRLDAVLPDGTGMVLFSPGEFDLDGIVYSPGPLNISVTLKGLPTYGELEGAGYYSEEKTNNGSRVRKNNRPAVMISKEGITRTIVTETYRKIERDLNSDGMYEIIETNDFSGGGTRIDLDYDSDGIIDYSYFSNEGNEQWHWTEYPVTAE